MLVYLSYLNKKKISASGLRCNKLRHYTGFGLHMYINPLKAQTFCSGIRIHHGCYSVNKTKHLLVFVCAARCMQCVTPPCTFLHSGMVQETVCQDSHRKQKHPVL